MQLSTLKTILRTLENLPEGSISDALELIEAVEGAFASGAGEVPQTATPVASGAELLDSVVKNALNHRQWAWRSIQALADAAKNAGLTVTSDAIRESVTRVGGRRNRRGNEVYGLVTRVGR